MLSSLVRTSLKNVIFIFHPARDHRFFSIVYGKQRMYNVPKGRILMTTFLDLLILNEDQFYKHSEVLKSLVVL